MTRQKALDVYYAIQNLWVQAIYQETEKHLFNAWVSWAKEWEFTEVELSTGKVS